MFNWKYFFIIFVSLGIFLNAQVKVVNKKGTEVEIDSSKWTQSGINIYNKNTGNIGIGSTTPGQKLSVAGAILVDASGTNTGTFANSLIFGITTSGEAIGSKRTGGSNQFGLDFYTGGFNRLAITNGGNVGIGNTNPLAKLHTTGTLRFQGLGTNTVDTNILTTNAAGDVTTRTITSLLNASWSLAGNATTNPTNDFLGTTDTQDLVFRTQNAEKMRLFSQNTQPAFGLGRNTLTGVNGGASTFSGPTLFLGTAGNFSSSTGFDFIIDDDNNATTSQFIFKANGDGASGTLELMQINETGNVGIGLPSGTAAAKLHTNGTLKFEGLATNTTNTNILTTNGTGDVTTKSTSNIVAGTSSASATLPLVLDAGATNSVIGGANATLTVNNTAPIWNANQIQSRNIATTAPTDRQLLSWDATTSTWKPDGYTVQTVTGTAYTLSAADHGKILDFTSTTAITVTVPTVLTTGFQVSITQADIGVITFAVSGGMVLNNRWNATKTAGRWSKAGIEVRAANSSVLSGDVL